MDHTTRTIYKLPIHKHSLFPSAHFIKAECDGCHKYDNMYGGYRCNHPNCYGWFHKDCAEASLEINHPSHPQHPLLLTKDSIDGSCDLCGQKLSSPCYTCCSKCEFKVDFLCGIKPPPSRIEHPLCHDHSLVFLKKRDGESNCEVCKNSIDGSLYSCFECNNVCFHVGCIHFSKEFNHPCHTIHPLKLIASDTLEDDDAKKTCIFCGQDKINIVLYYCSICNFPMCLDCTKNPPPIVFEHIKTHKHPLTLRPRKLSFTCAVCGEEGNEWPYVCLECAFVIHARCIGLPRVININRHDHRISFTHHLGSVYSKCGVCRKNVSMYHGAYCCAVCSNYAVHSTCAVKFSVWNGEELEGIPEIIEDIAPFKVVGDNLITHFSHEKHPLKLHKENAMIHSDKWLQCEACIYPVGFEPFYVCKECCFILHEKCANLLKKKRIVFDMEPYTLRVVTTGSVNCKHCRSLSDGFKYMLKDKLVIDVHCGSLSEPLFHDGHSHPLYFKLNDGHYCHGCNYDVDGYVFRCDVCDSFDLCFYCANLPQKIWHVNDDHSLTLYCGEKASYNNWCDVCEKKLDPCKWFYTVCTRRFLASQAKMVNCISRKSI